MFIDMGWYWMAKAAQEEEQRFAKLVADMPADMRDKMIADRAAAREKARREALEERRHQELCAAIRSTRFWP